jgi:hypothetical protein
LILLLRLASVAAAGSASAPVGSSVSASASGSGVSPGVSTRAASSVWSKRSGRSNNFVKFVELGDCSNMVGLDNIGVRMVQGLGKGKGCFELPGVQGKLELFLGKDLGIVHGNRCKISQNFQEAIVGKFLSISEIVEGGEGHPGQIHSIPLEGWVRGGDKAPFNAIVNSKSGQAILVRKGFRKNRRLVELSEDSGSLLSSESWELEVPGYEAMFFFGKEKGLGRLECGELLFIGELILFKDGNLVEKVLEDFIHGRRPLISLFLLIIVDSRYVVVVHARSRLSAK